MDCMNMPPLWGQSFWVNIDIFKYTSLLCERLVFSVQKYTDKEYRCNKYQECGNSHCKQNSDNLHPSGTVVMKREDLLYVQIIAADSYIHQCEKKHQKAFDSQFRT